MVESHAAATAVRYMISYCQSRDRYRRQSDRLSTSPVISNWPPPPTQPRSLSFSLSDYWPSVGRQLVVAVRPSVRRVDTVIRDARSGNVACRTQDVRRRRRDDQWRRQTAKTSTPLSNFIHQRVIEREKTNKKQYTIYINLRSICKIIKRSLVCVCV